MKKIQNTLDRLIILLYLCKIWRKAGAVAKLLGRLMIPRSNGFFYSNIGSVTEYCRNNNDGCSLTPISVLVIP